MLYIYIFVFSRSGKIESATVTYVQRQAVAFFAGVLETSLEFRKAFCKNQDKNNHETVISDGSDIPENLGFGSSGGRNGLKSTHRARKVDIGIVTVSQKIKKSPGKKPREIK